MTGTAKDFNSPGIEPVPPPHESTTIGGRAETWTLPTPRIADDDFEPTIIRGRE